jgi:FixJ family two-component response regulator
MSENAASSIVYVVDDDASIRHSLLNLFRSMDLHAVAFGSPAEFLKRPVCDLPGCLILDIRMPGASGLDFQVKLADESIDIPIIFLTGHGDIQMTVQAMKAGAIDFLTNPYREQDLLDTVIAAIERDRKRRENARSRAELRTRFSTLSSREQEIMGLVTSGLMNKQVAALTDLAEVTVKMHRGSVMTKMGARTFANLVRMADVLDIARKH